MYLSQETGKINWDYNIKTVPAYQYVKQATMLDALRSTPLKSALELICLAFLVFNIGTELAGGLLVL